MMFDGEYLFNTCIHDGFFFNLYACFYSVCFYFVNFYSLVMLFYSRFLFYYFEVFYFVVYIVCILWYVQ